MPLLLIFEKFACKKTANAKGKWFDALLVLSSFYEALAHLVLSCITGDN